MGENLFSGVLRGPRLFRNKEALRPNFTPDSLLHRDEESRAIAHHLAPILRGETVDNLRISGREGSGKTAVISHVVRELEHAAESIGKSVRVVQMDCGVVDTPYRVLAQTANHLARSFAEHVPFTGWPTSEVVEVLTDRMNAVGTPAVLVLDQLEKFSHPVGLY